MRTLTPVLVYSPADYFAVISLVLHLVSGRRATESGIVYEKPLAGSAIFVTCGCTLLVGDGLWMA